MYPKREEFQWRPSPLLCKRFDLVDPYMGKVLQVACYIIFYSYTSFVDRFGSTFYAEYFNNVLLFVACTCSTD